MKPALILFKKENKKKVTQEIDEKLDEVIKEKNIEDEEFFGSIHTIRGTELRIYVLNIVNWFDSYREFDNFLLELEHECGLNELEERGVLIGHLDEKGGIWTDYPTKLTEKSRKNEVKH